VEQQKLAVIGVSEASGLWRLAATECDPVRATSFGTGELMLHAAERGARTILVGLGGSATTDGGVGIAAALGYEMITSDGERYDVGSGALREIARIRRPENATELPPVIAASDVESPLLGVRGTARVFSPQKGADAETIETLELGLQHLCDIVRRDLGSDFADVPGAGAAGGIGFGLLSFCSAEIRSGFDVVAEMLGLEELIGWADLIITGEGRIDVQTLEGKGPAGVARLAKRHGKPVVAFAGSVAADVSFADLFNAIYAVIDEPADLDEARRRGEEFLERAAERAAKLMQVGAELRHASS
jgi:glycerate kinase